MQSRHLVQALDKRVVNVGCAVVGAKRGSRAGGDPEVAVHVNIVIIVIVGIVGIEWVRGRIRRVAKSDVSTVWRVGWRVEVKWCGCCCAA